MRLKIKNEEIRKLLNIEEPLFPKYTTQLLNLANQNAQATRPKIVGQLSELIKEFDGKTLEEWKKWYLQRYPDAIETATEKIYEMIGNLKEAIEKIDKDMIRKWVEDLVITKTFLGLRFQEAILKKLAKEFNTNYRLATPSEESKGIDGYIGDIPISIKPLSYKQKDMLQENLKGFIVFYEKTKDGLTILISDELVDQLKK